MKLFYDYETGLYYCQGRYYFPVWSRFINMNDARILNFTQKDTLGNNLYVYCINNPVNFINTTRYWVQYYYGFEWTSKDFNPKDYPESRYYYCVITSTDNGYNPIEFRTGTTENKTIHIHTEEEIPTVAPTCTGTRLTAVTKCSECGEILITQQEVPALGHNYNSVANAPTCTENGSKDVVFYCSECEEEISTETVALNATGHNDDNCNGYCDICSETVEVKTSSNDCDCGCHQIGLKKSSTLSFSSSNAF